MLSYSCCAQFFSKAFHVAFCQLVGPPKCWESDSGSEVIDGLDKPSSVKKAIQALILPSQNCDKPLPQGNFCEKLRTFFFFFFFWSICLCVCVCVLLKLMYLLEKAWQGLVGDLGVCMLNS